MTVSSPTLINDWAQFAGINLGPIGAARSVDVTFDRVRLRMFELPSRSILLESRISDLPMAESERDRMVHNAMVAATGRMRDSPVVLCANEDASALVLQLQIPSGADVPTLDAALAKLVNEVDVWRALL